jgi:hypothetical protein
LQIMEVRSEKNHYSFGRVKFWAWEFDCQSWVWFSPLGLRLSFCPNNPSPRQTESGRGGYPCRRAHLCKIWSDSSTLTITLVELVPKRARTQLSTVLP